MKSATSNTKTIVTIIVVFIVILLTYFYFEGGSSTGTGSLLESSGNGAGSVGSSELSLLNQIQSLRIDTELFKDPVYRSLQDYSVDIPSENVGRPNPFAPVPGVGLPNTTGAGVAPTIRR